MIDVAPTTAASTRVQRVPKLGFIGVGWIGRNRLEAIAASGVAEIAAISDPQADAVAATAKDQPDIYVASSFEDMLSLADLVGVVIATPNACHVGQSIAALEAGKAVFCQKPLGRTGPETQRVIDAARAADRLLGVDLSYRFTSGMQGIKRLISAGELGTIYAAELVFHNAYGPDKAWFYDSQLSGGGCLLDLGIHLVDLGLWCLDFPSVVSATGQLLAGGKPWRSEGVEDYAAAQLVTETGASIQLACSWRVPAGYDAKIEVTFFGTRGGASFRNVNGSFYDFVAEHVLPDRSCRLLSKPPEAWGGAAAVAWARQLSLDPSFDPTVAHLRSVADTLDRVYGRTS
jgi:predicted dehydrogenase